MATAVLLELQRNNMFKYFVQFTSPSTLSRGEVDDIGRMLTEALAKGDALYGLYTSKEVDEMIKNAIEDWRHNRTASVESLQGASEL
jgi:hypothetical protein